MMSKEYYDYVALNKIIPVGIFILVLLLLFAFFVCYFIPLISHKNNTNEVDDNERNGGLTNADIENE